jgi:hypothetical protein
VVQAHRWRKRLGLRCLTVRVKDLIGTGYFSLESKEDTTAIAINLEAWIYDNILWASRTAVRLCEVDVANFLAAAIMLSDGPPAPASNPRPDGRFCPENEYHSGGGIFQIRDHVNEYSP